MNKDHLVFDWRGSETRLIDKIVAALVVTIAFIVSFKAIDVRVGSAFENTSDTASIIRFDSEDLANRWLLIAEEGGPFPGRMEIVSRIPGSDSSLEAIAGDPFADGDYEVSLRNIEPDFGVSQVELAPKGLRFFPKITDDREPVELDSSLVAAGARQPVLKAYDKSAAEWLPEELPVFSPGESLETSGSPWRFALGLRSDGTVQDCICLGGGEAGLAEISEWLHRVTFTPGEEERWLGLRVELINLRDDGSRTE